MTDTKTEYTPSTPWATPFGEYLFQKQHALRPGETLSEGLTRVANFVATAETAEVRRVLWADGFNKLLQAGKFCPGGRILAGAGSEHGQMLNCFDGQTEILTEWGFRDLESLYAEGDLVKIVSPVDGRLYFAKPVYHGKQPLNTITLSGHSKSTHMTSGITVTATPNHRWVLADGSITTNLRVGDIVAPAMALCHAPDHDGFTHGLVVGDGSRTAYDNRFQLRLCGNKDSLLDVVKRSSYYRNHTYPPSAGLDPTVSLVTDVDLKSIPDNRFNSSYLSSFIRGLLAADGCMGEYFGTNGQLRPYQFHSTDLHLTEWLRDHLCLAGYSPTGEITVDTKPSNFGPRHPLYALRFRKTEDHKGYKVVSIEHDRVDHVFCVEEPVHHQITLRRGLRSGNCFVIDADHEDPSSVEGVMQLAKRLALVTKTGGGCGTNLDDFKPMSSAVPAPIGNLTIVIDDVHVNAGDVLLGRTQDPAWPDNPERKVRGYRYANVRATEEIEVTEDIVYLLVPDSIDGIFDAAATMVNALLAGQNVTVDLSDLREEGAEIRGSGGTSSGPQTFAVEVFDSFAYWAKLGADHAGAVNTLRYVMAPTLRCIRQGGCLPRSAMVSTQFGLKSIADVCVGEYVFTFNGLQQVTHKWDKGVQPLIRLESRGMGFTCTPEHRTAVLVAGAVEYKLAKDIKIGDTLLFNKSPQEFVAQSKMPAMDIELDQQATPITIPDLDEDIAWFLGYCLGNGTSGLQSKMVSLAYNSNYVEMYDDELSDRITASLESFGVNARSSRVKGENTECVKASSSGLSKYLNRHIKKPHETIRVPAFINSAPLSVRGAFLAGLMDSDGSVLTKPIRPLTTIYPEFASDVQNLYASLGIPTRISKEVRPNPDWSDLYTLALVGFKDEYNELVGQYSVKACVDNTRRVRFDYTVPLDSVTLSPSQYRGKWSGLGMGYDAFIQAGGTLQGIPVKVTGVTEVEPEETWDIEVANGENYIANGFHTHNCRRGAGMATISIDHPEILNFMTAKDKDRQAIEGDISTYNVSIKVTDKFMKRVESDGVMACRDPLTGEFEDVVSVPGKYEVNTVLSTEAPFAACQSRVGVNARWLFDEIAKHAHHAAEPGLLFIDHVNDNTPVPGVEATNPCFTGDTKVWTSSGQRTFADLASTGDSVEVLTQLEDGRLAYRTMRAPRRTQENAELVKVTLDNGETVRCTPQHVFFLRDNSKKEAAELEAGDRIESVYRYNANQKGYKRLTNGFHTPLEHHVRWEDGVPEGYHVHHVDSNKANNDPSNLQLMEASEHNSMHMRGDNNPSRRFPERNQLIQQDHSGENNGRYRHDISDDDLKRRRDEGASFKTIAKEFGVSRYTVMKRLGWERPSNHRVVSVEALLETEDVYCGTVDETHRFFVALGKDDGILVSNCGEQPMMPSECCDLGAMVLPRYVKNKKFSWSEFHKDIQTAVRFLDNVLDINQYPLPDTKEVNQKYRRIGLGIMGLADTLALLGLPYDSEEGRDFVYTLGSFMAGAAELASVDLAEERGVPEGCAGAGLKRRNVQLLTVAPTGCVEGSTLISSSESGMKPISSLGDVEGETWQDIDIRIHTDEGIKTATKFFVNGKRPVIQMTTKLGYSLTATENHQVRVVDENGDYIWRRMDSLANGDTVALLKGTHSSINRASLVGEVENQHLTDLSLPSQMSENLSLLLGFYVGNGYTKAKGGLHLVINDADADVLETLSSAGREVFGCSATSIEDRQGCRILNLNGRDIPRFFNDNGFTKAKGNEGQGAADAAIPLAVLASDSSCLSAFLRGLFEADGCISNNRVTLSSVSLQLVRQVQTALLGLGMISSIRKLPAQPSRLGTRPLYELSLRSRLDTIRFREVVGFIGTRKQDKLNLVDNAQLHRGNSIKHQALLDDFYAVSHGLPNAVRQTILIAKRQGSISCHMAERFISSHPSLGFSKLGKLLAMGLLLDVVKETVAGECDTFDLSVPDNVTYIANGFVSHNTTSNIMGCSGGIEPPFALKYQRRVGENYIEVIEPVALKLVEDRIQDLGKGLDEPLPSATEIAKRLFKSGLCADLLETDFDVLAPLLQTSNEIPYTGHVQMQGVLQRAFDIGKQSGASISKTINLPKGSTWEDVRLAYGMAYEQECKGITVYVDGSYENQVLSTGASEPEPETQPEITEADWANFDPTYSRSLLGEPLLTPHEVQSRNAFVRPTRMFGYTYQVSLSDPGSGEAHKYLITTNFDSSGKPVEVIMVAGKGGSRAHGEAEAIGRLASLALQQGVGVDQISRSLAGIDAGLFGSHDKRLVRSPAALLAVILENTTDYSQLQQDKTPNEYSAPPEQAQVEAAPFGRCPECDTPLKRHDGCIQCMDGCGEYSKCG